ncbi:MAG: ABC transporter permease [Clostridiales bacterium]|nr:ABC transporter permease [Clostridiales bacterium]
MSIIQLSLNNIKNNIVKFIIFSIILGLMFSLVTFSFNFNNSLKSSLSKQLDALESQNYIDVSPRIINDDLPVSILDTIRSFENVEGVQPRYQIAALLEESEGVPIYNVQIDGLNSNSSLPDFTYNGEEGIILPDLKVNLNREVALKDYIGKTLRIVFDIYENDEIKSEVIEAKVIGVYTTSGDMEQNPLYLSSDLFKSMYSKIYPDTQPAVKGAVVYVDNIKNLDSVALRIEELGLIASYGLKNMKDYFNSLETIKNIISIAAFLIIALLLLLIIQNLISNVEKRKKTIGVMKVYGYSNAKILSMVCFEVSFYIISSIIISLIITFSTLPLIKDLLSNILQGEFYTLNYITFVYIVIIGFAIVNLALIKPYIRIKSSDPINILSQPS